MPNTVREECIKFWTQYFLKKHFIDLYNVCPCTCYSYHNSYHTTMQRSINVSLEYIAQGHYWLTNSGQSWHNNKIFHHCQWRQFSFLFQWANFKTIKLPNSPIHVTSLPHTILCICMTRALYVSLLESAYENTFKQIPFHWVSFILSSRLHMQEHISPFISNPPSLILIKKW